MCLYLNSQRVSRDALLLGKQRFRIVRHTAAINGLQLAQFTYVADGVAIDDQQIGMTPRCNAAEIILLACRYRAATDVTALIAAIEPIASANSSISRNRAKPGGG